MVAAVCLQFFFLSTFLFLMLESAYMAKLLVGMFPESLPFNSASVSGAGWGPLAKLACCCCFVFVLVFVSKRIFRTARVPLCSVTKEESVTHLPYPDSINQSIPI